MLGRVAGGFVVLGEGGGVGSVVVGGDGLVVVVVGGVGFVVVVVIGGGVVVGGVGLVVVVVGGGVVVGGSVTVLGVGVVGVGDGVVDLVVTMPPSPVPSSPVWLFPSVIPFSFFHFVYSSSDKFISFTMTKCVLKKFIYQ